MRNLDTPIWSNDGKRVCYMGKPVRGADAKSFEVMLGNYARDARSVFFHSIRSPKIDRATFRALNANFGVDSSQAYFVVTPIRGADPQTFRVLDSSFAAEPGGHFLQAGYASDASSVWFASGAGIYRLKTADSKSFVSMSNRYGVDGKHVFFEHSMIPDADRATWRPWRELLSVDKDSVFFTNKRVPDVDRASIWLLTSGSCFMDRHRIYCGVQPITAEQYVAEHLKYCADACAREREALPSGKLFDRILNEWPKNI
jgi:hypothetical protein